MSETVFAFTLESMTRVIRRLGAAEKMAAVLRANVHRIVSWDLLPPITADDLPKYGDGERAREKAVLEALADWDAN